MLKKPTNRKKKFRTLDFLRENGVALKKPGLTVSHYTITLMFLAFVAAVVASIAMKNPWPILAVAGALGFRSILATVLRR